MNRSEYEEALARQARAAEDAQQSVIQRQFELFHSQNPSVYVLFVKYARQLRNRGFDRGSISLLTERVRWEVIMTTRDEASEFKINNNYRSRYARLIMEREPDLRDFFEVRRLRERAR